MVYIFVSDFLFRSSEPIRLVAPVSKEFAKLFKAVKVELPPMPLKASKIGMKPLALERVCCACIASLTTNKAAK